MEFPAPMAGSLIGSEDLPAAPTLLGPRAAELFEQPLLPYMVEEMRPRQVVPRLGASLVVVYEAILLGPDGELSIRTLAARAGGRLPPAATIVSDGHEQVALWVYPHDPELPSLAALFDPLRRLEVLEHLGVSPPADADIAAVAGSYRPGRRAIVELTWGSDRCFGKAILPRSTDGLLARHQLFERHVRVPTIRGSNGEGLVLFDPLPGRTLLEVLAMGSQKPPEGDEILAVLNRIPSFEHRVTSPVERLGDRTRLLRLLVPDLSDLLNDIERSVGFIGTEPIAGIHGDMHAGQIMVDEKGELGLIDLDSAGYGHRADELAGLLAHLVATNHGGYAEQLFEVFSAGSDPLDLWRRAAAALLGFATVPYVNQEPDWPEKVAALVTLAGGASGRGRSLMV
ncbi:MAG: phosphotransferase family protein [Actinomycetota bacterium]